MLFNTKWLGWMLAIPTAAMRFDLGPHELGMTTTEIMDADDEEANDGTGAFPPSKASSGVPSLPRSIVAHPPKVARGDGPAAREDGPIFEPWPSSVHGAIS